MKMNNTISKKDNSTKKRKDWKANTNEVPGLEADLNKLMIETNSKTHGELLSKLSFAHRNIDTVDKLWKLTLKPDIECSKREMVAKRIIIKLYNFSGVSTREISELILDEIDKIDKVQETNKDDNISKTRRRIKKDKN